MNLDPSTFNVKQKKMMGLWPPQDSIAVALIPYIKRQGDGIEVLDIGVGKGEDIVYLSENAGNIRTIYGLSHNNDHEDLLNENIKDVSNVQKNYGGTAVDVILISMLPDIKPSELAQCYDKVKVGGIFAGDLHNEAFVVETLTQFRRENRIGTPINIVDKRFWFWKKS